MKLILICVTKFSPHLLVYKIAWFSIQLTNTVSVFCSSKCSGSDTFIETSTPSYYAALHSIFLSHTLHTIQFQRLAESLIAKSMLGSHMSLILIICENLYKSHFPSPYGPQNACISERYILRRTNQTT